MLIALLTPALAAPAPLATVSEVRFTASFYLDSEADHREYLALRPDSAMVGQLMKSTEGSEPENIDSDGGTYHRYDLNVTTVDGLSIGDRWRLSGEQTNAVCTVSGFEMVASPEARAGATEEDAGAPCSAPLFVARVDCAQDATGAWFAVPASAPVPVWATKADGEITLEKRRQLLRDGTVSGLQAAVSEGAANRNEPMKSEVTTQTYRLGDHTIQSVKGTFYTGAGEDECGGEDLASRWSTLIIDGAVRPPEQTWRYWLSGVIDLDGDGEPEVLEQINGEQQIRDASGNVLRAHMPEWCVCGC
ncbi:MAG: hypothetical protein ACI8RZ_005090 [Myxococcota bacterium]|jgi:hypothetical protein